MTGSTCRGLAGGQTREGCCVESEGNPDTVNTGRNRKERSLTLQDTELVMILRLGNVSVSQKRVRNEMSSKEMFAKAGPHKNLEGDWKNSLSVSFKNEPIFVELVGNCARLTVGLRATRVTA